MVFLINASNIKAGGGIQVAQSICGQLGIFTKHNFIVVLSKMIDDSHINFASNSIVFKYDISNSFHTIIKGRDFFLDNLVIKYNVVAVLTIFGPSRWRPKVPHLCGFARAQLVLKDSPYYKRLTLKEVFIYKLWTWLFKKSSDTFYTENEYISRLLPELVGPKAKVFTVTNYYNQVYDHLEMCKRSVWLPVFDGVTLLSVSSHYPHKNFEIAIEVSKYLQCFYPDFNFRFVLTFNENEMHVPEDVKKHFLFIGKVDVSECPFLYEQADIMFMPTLMECFTATYPEAMRMAVPIVTTDLEFAHGLCGDSACYYSAVDSSAAAEAIYKVATDSEFSRRLVENGKRQLAKYDDYEQRAKKLVKILEDISKY